VKVGHKRLLIGAAAVGMTLAAVSIGSTAVATDRDRGSNSIREQLSGYEEDPKVISTNGSGTFRATIDERGKKINYRLSFNGLEGNVTQAHIHIGGKAQSGGVFVFLCSNLPGAPAGTPACPTGAGTVSGTITPTSLLPVADQSLAAGDFNAVVGAIRAGATYVNVHTAAWPGGEVRGQID
jgi:hypothetical protein